MPKDRQEKTSSKGQTYDFICFTDLAYEFNIESRREVEKKIKRRLKYHKLGDYNQERVDYIRRLKDDLYAEISRTTKSGYFQKSPSLYADLADFDIARMTADYHKKYDTVNKDELKGMIEFSVYLHHMR